MQRKPGAKEDPKVNANTEYSVNRLTHRLKAIRLHLDKTQAGMDELLGLGKNSWQRYERGDNAPGSPVLEALVIQGFNANWLLAEVGQMTWDGKSVRDQEAACDAEFAYIPKLLPVEVSTGGGSTHPQDIAIQNHAFRKDWLSSKGLTSRNLAIVSGKGDSMEPTVPDGSTLLVDRSITEFNQDGIYVVRLDGHLYAKRLQRGQAGSLLVISDNHFYDRIEINTQEQENFSILGKVVWLGRSI